MGTAGKGSTVIVTGALKEPCGIIRVTAPPDAVRVPPAGLATTSTLAVPLIPAVVAEMVTLPFGPTAIARPDDETVVTPSSDELHVNDWSVIVAPFWSRADGVSWTVSPAVTSVAEFGVTTTVVTLGVGGGGVVGVESPPSQVATRKATNTAATDRKARLNRGE